MHFLFFFIVPPVGVGDHNYCRNPDSSEKPWCYIAGPDGAVQRQICSIDTCRGRFIDMVGVHSNKELWERLAKNFTSIKIGDLTF